MDRSTLHQEFIVPTTASYIRQGTGRPVVLVHGMAASYHNWDDLSPLLVESGYSTYALDLLGHGDSPKPASRAYHMKWMFDHFANWMDSLKLTEAPVLVGHSLGGYLSLEYARRFPERTQSLVLVDPLYSISQLPAFLRRTYRRPHLSGLLEKTPNWMFRLIVDMSSVAMGNGTRSLHSLPERVRAQTAFDYGRTSPGAYNVINESIDITEEHLARISHPALVIWGDRDQTLAPASFPQLVNQMPHATGRVLRAGHVPHQSNTEEFNQIVMEFLEDLS